jgi:hypothetical protein
MLHVSVREDVSEVGPPNVFSYDNVQQQSGGAGNEQSISVGRFVKRCGISRKGTRMSGLVSFVLLWESMSNDMASMRKLLWYSLL